MVPIDERPLRRDAARNRARVAHAAAGAFGAAGLEVGVDEIARRAGVGVATLYRHFPAKADLVLAVLDQVVDDLVAEIPVLVGTSRHPLRDFLIATVEVQSANRGLLDALAVQAADGEVRRRLGERMLGALAALASAAHRSGELRAELDADDLLVVVRMLGAAGRDPRRYLDIALRGLAP